MKIIYVTIATFFVLATGFFTVKFWGQGQTYVEYKHPIFDVKKTPLIFVKPSYENLHKALKDEANLFLNVTATADQKLVVPLVDWQQDQKPIHYSAYEEIKDKVVLLADYKNIITTKKIIFNIYVNSQAIHEIFVHNIKELGLEKGENFIVTSPFEAPIKALKEIAPAFVYGSTQPEILKIVSMQSMYLLEALNLRADVVVQPLTLKKHFFFNEELLAELKKRYKKIIVGPLAAEEREAADKLEPFAVIVND